MLPLSACYYYQGNTISSGLATATDGHGESVISKYIFKAEFNGYPCSAFFRLLISRPRLYLSFSLCTLYKPMPADFLAFQDGLDLPISIPGPLSVILITASLPFGTWLSQFLFFRSYGVNHGVPRSNKWLDGEEAG